MSSAVQTTPRLRRSQEERSRTTRAAIIDAAIRRICRLGAAGTVMNDIAAEANLTKGALQHHFVDKNELLATVIETGWRELIETIRTIPSTGGSLAERVDAVVEHMWASYTIPAVQAAVVIHLAARREERLSGRHGRLLGKAQELLDAEWQRVFADAPAPAERVHSARRLARSMLGGMLYQSEMEPDQYHPRADLDLLKETLLLILSGAPD